MKINWGWSIAIFYTLFVSFFIVILFYSFTLDNSLVVDDYYQLDVTWHERMDKTANYDRLPEKITHRYDPENHILELVFPTSFREVEGTVQFYRPSSARQDYEVPISVDEDNRQVIPIRRLIPGHWKINIECVADGMPYYCSEQLVVLRAG